MARKGNRAERDVLLDLLRSARERSGLTQTDLAKRLGRPQSFVSKYERGEVRLDIFELRRVCVALGVPLRTLVGRLEAALQK